MSAWVAAWLAALASQSHAVVNDDVALELELRRKAQRVRLVQHAAALVALATGASLMFARGWSLDYPRWLAVKLGLVAFLLLPLEAMLAYVGFAWIRPGLAESAPSAPSGGQFSKKLARGLSMEAMIRTIAIVLLGIAVPVLLWLSIVKPF